MFLLYQDRIIEKSNASISPDDRGYYFGDGIYEVFRVYNGRLFEQDAHFARLQRTADAVRIPLPYGQDKLLGRLEELIAAEQLREGIVYIQITRGAAPRTHAFPAQAEPVLMAYAQPLQRPLQAVENGIAVVTIEDIRWLRCDLKTLNLLANVLAKQESLDRGAQDAVFHRSGIVTECSSSNIMIVHGGAIITHPADNYILHGVTRAVALRLARELGIDIREERFDVEALLAADEAFITGTTSEFTPVTVVDGSTIGNGKPGPVTRRLQQAFEEAIK